MFIKREKRRGGDGEEAAGEATTSQDYNDSASMRYCQIRSDTISNQIKIFN